jgi:2-iminoacetate synthase ThiH
MCLQLNNGRKSKVAKKLQMEERKIQSAKKLQIKKVVMRGGETKKCRWQDYFDANFGLNILNEN